MSSLATPYGVAIQVGSSKDLQQVIDCVIKEGYSQIEAFAPYPDEKSIQLLDLKPSMIPACALVGGILGGLTGYLIQYYTAVIQYPMDVGGKALHSWPAFIPITFECTVLGSALLIFIGFFIIHRLPQLYHPLFNVNSFELISRDQFALCIKAQDPLWNYEKICFLLQSLKSDLNQPSEVYDVPM
jgi:hypothetical protein